MNSLLLVLRQVRYENKSFWRNPLAAFFTFVFPLMFLVIFNLLFGNEDMELPGGTVKLSNFYVPGIAAMGLISACYTNIAIGVTISRDQGLLKRMRGTPLPPWAFLAGRIIHAIFVGLLLVVIVTAAGKLLYGVEVPTNTLPGLVAALAVGTATFCALGLAVTPFIHNADASPAVANGTILPLLFISDIFIPMDNAPAWLMKLAEIFPVKHLSASLLKAFNPFETGNGSAPGDLAVMVVWLAAALLVALRFFSWEPRR